MRQVKVRDPGDSWGQDKQHKHGRVKGRCGALEGAVLVVALQVPTVLLAMQWLMVVVVVGVQRGVEGIGRVV